MIYQQITQLPTFDRDALRVANAGPAARPVERRCGPFI
jgi:hypothetical protein